jgi:hypothetical protein
MKSISLERTPERVELLKRMGDSNRAIAGEAQEAFASFLGPVIKTVLDQKATSAQIYQDLEFNENDRPSIPVDLYLGTYENNVRVWSQNMPGGLPTNVVQGLSEYTFNVYELDSAISFAKSYLKQARLDVVTAGIERMIQEILVKQERNAWAVILSALATATINGASHIIPASKAGEFLPQDLNNLRTKIARMFTSFAGGTPTDASIPAGLTDLYVSPEIMNSVRSLAYNPVNTRSGLKSDGTETSAGNIALPDAVRADIFRSAGVTEFQGVSLHQMVELGVNQKYNKVFDNAYSGSFNPATQEVAIGLDLSRPVFLRPVVLNDEAAGGQILVRPDDQYISRSEKAGFYSKVREGRVLLDDRAVTGIIL